MKKKSPPLASEKDRLEALLKYKILDTPQEEEFDSITKLASYICQTPIALISLIDENRQWFKSRIGLDVTETHRDISFCQHAIMDDTLFEIPNALNDNRFKNNPLVTGAPDIQFYAGTPLKSSSGFNIGTLCVIDKVPRNLTSEQKEGLETLGKQVIAQLELREKNRELKFKVEKLAAENAEKITSQKKLVIKNDELEKTNQQLYEADKFFTMSLDMLCIASGEYFTKINPAFTNILGYDEKVLLDQPFLSFFHPDDVQATLDEVAKLRQGILTIDFENRFRCKDGSYRWLAWTASSDISTGLLYAVAHDITEFKTKEEELINSEKQISIIFKNALDAVILMDDKGIIVKWNPKAETLFGWTAEEAIGKYLHETIIPERYREAHLNEMKNYSKTGEGAELNKTTEISALCKDNTEFEMAMGISPTVIQNHTFFISFIKDITERKKIETELKRAKASAEEAVIAKDAFLANMSHEIRTPMNAIIGFTDLIIQTELDEEQKKYITNVKNAGENLLAIINDILDLSKIESGKLLIESYPFNLKETLKNAQNLLKEKAKEKKIEYNYFLDTELPGFVVGDSNRLNQVMINLVGNAIKFTSEGSVTVAVKKIDEDEQHYKLHFSVKDTGIGISQNKLDIIFERFTQANTDTTRKFGGTGLGLNIAKSFIEMQGGELKVKSEEGKGSEFYFTIVYKKVDKSITAALQNTLPLKQTLGNVKILLSEDNIINQELAKSVIKKFGFELHVVNNGKECIELLKSTSFDLILMDLQMPEMDGYQATRFIRNELKLNIPIIAMTAHSLIGEKEKCIEIGMNDYVPKPFKQNDLYNKIVSVLKHKPENEALLQAESKKPYNLNYLLEMEDLDFLNEVLQIFLDSTPGSLSEISQAITDENWVQVYEKAHKLKSSLGVFQLNKMLALVSQIELDAKEKRNLPRISENLDIAEAHFLDIIPMFKNEIENAKLLLTKI